MREPCDVNVVVGVGAAAAVAVKIPLPHAVYFQKQIHWRGRTRVFARAEREQYQQRGFGVLEVDPSGD